MKVWLIKIGETLPIENNLTLVRNGHLAAALAAQNHEVVWWASTFSHKHKRYLFDGPRTIQAQPNLEVRLLHGPAYNKNVSLKRIVHHHSIARSFARESRSVEKPDIIFCSVPTLELAEQALRYGRDFAVPVVIDIVDTWPDVYLTILPPWLRPLGEFVLRSDFRRLQQICRSAVALTAVSQTYLDWALHHARRPINALDGLFVLGCPATSLVTQAAIEQQATQVRSRYGIREQDLVVTFIGTFGVSYDIETVVAAARMIEQDQIQGVRFVLAGSGDKLDNMRQMAEGLSNVTFPGWLSEQPMRELLHVSSIGLAAYTQRALQSLPYKPFEYMAAGLPMLSSLSGELEQIIRTEGIGLQYKAGDAAGLVKQIRWCLSNPDQLRLMSARTRKLFNTKYDSAQVYARLVAHLEYIVTTWQEDTLAQRCVS
jgi:glycosyltransferase involved in cell wall biosynthesis